MAKAKNGDNVKVEYTGRLTDGTVFDSNVGKQPLDFEIGQGKLIPGFEKGVVGMAVGEEKIVEIPPDQAYGTRDEELVWQVSKEQLPGSIDPEVGMKLRSQLTNGQSVDLVVTSVLDESITVDANHALAGEALRFDIKLLEISQ